MMYALIWEFWISVSLINFSDYCWNEAILEEKKDNSIYLYTVVEPHSKEQ